MTGSGGNPPVTRVSYRDGSRRDAVVKGLDDESELLIIGVRHNGISPRRDDRVLIAVTSSPGVLGSYPLLSSNPA